MHYVVRLVIKVKILLVCQFDINQARMNNPSISTECPVNFFNQVKIDLVLYLMNVAISLLHSSVIRILDL